MSLASDLQMRAGWLRRSSTLRLTLLLSAIFAAGFTVAIFVALDQGQKAIDRRVDATLAALARASDPGVITGDSPRMILRASGDQRALPAPFARAVARGGGTVHLQTELFDAETWRVLVAPDSTGTPVMVAVPMHDSEQAQELLAGVLWTTAAIVIAATLAIGLATGLVAQRRLVKIQTVLDKLAAGDLTARTGHVRSRDDLDDIARQLDISAAELERLVTQTRHLSASIAHDLRTPLARLRAQLETLPESAERGSALEELDRLSGIFDTIMRVARIEAAQGREGFEPVALDRLTQEVAEIFGPVVEDEGKTLRIDIAAPAQVDADRPMLIQALANLIQNALVHGGKEITLFATGREIGVADNGAGVSPADFEEIVKPMVRLDAARSTAGSGLGLALVRAVADRHGADLQFASLTPQGLRVSIKFANL